MVYWVIDITRQSDKSKKITFSKKDFEDFIGIYEEKKRTCRSNSR